MTGKQCVLIGMAFLACASFGSAQAPKPDLRIELSQAQGKLGLTLLVAERDGSIQALDFEKRTLCQLYPASTGVRPYTRYSLCWSKKLLAGNVGTERVFTAELGTQAVKWLTDCGSYDMAWNHKGEKLAYVTSVARDKDDIGIFVMDVPNRKDTLIVDRAAPDTTPQWSADDSQLVYHTDKGQVVIVALDTGRKTKVTEGTYPSWHPDGKSVVYYRKGRFWMCSLNGTNVRPLTRLSIWKTVLNEPVRFSPKGEFAVFLRGWTDLEIVQHAELRVLRVCDLAEVAVFERPFGQRLPLTWAEVDQMKRK